MRITKVKSAKGKITVEYEKNFLSGDPDTYSLTCKQRAAPRFYAALESLRQSVLDICELNEAVDGITVTGVSLSYTDKDIMGATLIAQRELHDSASPMNLITPHKFTEYTSGGEEGDPRQLLPPDTAMALDDLILAATAYVEGEREQTTIPGAEDNAR